VNGWCLDCETLSLIVIEIYLIEPKIHYRCIVIFSFRAETDLFTEYRFP
jgi:hypothetical protein